MLQYIINIPKFIFDKYIFIVNWTKQWHICHYLVWTFVIGYLIIQCFRIYYFAIDHISDGMDFFCICLILIIGAEIFYVFPATLIIYFIAYLRKKDFKIKNNSLLYNPIYSIIYQLILIYIIYAFLD